MNNPLLNPWFYKLNQTLEDGDFAFTDIDLSWLKENKKNTFCLLNIASQLDTCPAVPAGRDLYVLSWFFEPFNQMWFREVYFKNPQAQFIVISDMDPNDICNYDRVKFFQLIHHSTWINAVRSKNTRSSVTELSKRNYKLSSLSSRLNEFKFFITAKLYKHNNPETLLSWNRGFDIGSKDRYVFDTHGMVHSDELLQFKDFLISNKINSQDFENNPRANSSFNHPAYLDSVINSVNETQCQSRSPDFGNLPTPYITEKTWKPLFAGNALLFTGQAGLKNKLESWGFKFDYPWAMNYDESFYDYQRLEIILSQINWILAVPISELINMSRDSVEHNIELAWSGRLETLFRHHNDKVIEELKQYLG